jgi:streptogramin lyase
VPLPAVLDQAAHQGRRDRLPAHRLALLPQPDQALVRIQVAVGEGAVWITDKNSQTLLRISPQYGEITRIRLPSQGLSRPGVGGGVAIGAGSVWVAQGQSRIARIDPASGRVESTVSIPDASEIAFGDGAIWAAASDLGTVTKIDPRTGTVVATARIGPWICCVAVGGGYV